MEPADFIALGSSAVALGALALTAYLARVNLAHQRLESHRGRIWERKVDALLELLRWAENAADSDTFTVLDGMSEDDCVPRLPEGLHTRVAAFTPDLTQHVAMVRLALGKVRFAAASAKAGTGSWDDARRWADEAGRQMELLRGKAELEIRRPPHQMDRLRPYLKPATASDDGKP